MKHYYLELLSHVVYVTWEIVIYGLRFEYYIAILYSNCLNQHLLFVFSLLAYWGISGLQLSIAGGGEEMIMQWAWQIYSSEHMQAILLSAQIASDW